MEQVIRIADSLFLLHFIQLVLTELSQKGHCHFPPGVFLKSKQDR